MSSEVDKPTFVLIEVPTATSAEQIEVFRVNDTIRITGECQGRSGGRRIFLAMTDGVAREVYRQLGKLLGEGADHAG